ncbi:hypothetical protein V2J09_020494, partial [Rumex salicifolius]
RRPLRSPFHLQVAHKLQSKISEGVSSTGRLYRAATTTANRKIINYIFSSFANVLDVAEYVGLEVDKPKKLGA